MKDDEIKDISFKESFRRARQAGLKDFSFGGKKYSTELKKAPSPAAKDAADMAERRAMGREAGSQARFLKSMSTDTGKGTVTDNPRDPAYFQGRVNPKTLLPLPEETEMKRGGKVKAYANGGATRSVTRADGCITKGHTKGRIR